MNEKEKKEFVNLVGQVVENAIEKKTLPLIDSIKLEVNSFRKESNKNFRKLGERMENIEGDLDKLEFKMNRFERKLENSIDRYDDKLESQEKRLVNLETKARN